MINQIQDSKGNSLILENKDKLIFVSLKLSAENKSRMLGTINREKRVIEIKRNSKKHLMYKIGGYGFNHKLLKESKTFDLILLNDENSQWLIPKTFILENGRILNFSQEGFELQIFIPLNKIKDFLVNPLF